jgi:hypothetical protein
MDRYAGMPAICVSEDRSNMTVTIPLLARHEASCYVPPDGVGTSVRDMLEKIGSTGKPIIVYLPDWIIEERGTPNLDYVKEIAAACGYSRYEKILGADESGLLTSAYLIE